MENKKLAWRLRAALLRYIWAEVTLDAGQPPNLSHGSRRWAPFWAKKGRVLWVDMQGARFDAPFSRMDFLRHILELGADSRITRIQAFEAIDEVPDGITPSGFVFHISRCGSTLLANMLGTLSRTLAVSEPEFVTSTLSGGSSGEIRARIKGGIAALGRSYTGSEKHFFIKFASSHTGKLPLFQECFPNVPMLFLYRDPFEVFRKVVYEGGSRWLLMRSNPRRYAQFIGLDPTLIHEISLDEYVARVIGKFFETATENSRAGLALLNYRNLTSPDCISGLLEYFGLDVNQDEFKKISSITNRDAKRPRQMFVAERGRSLSRIQRDLIEKWAMGPYEHLERLSSTGINRQLLGKELLQ